MHFRLLGPMEVLEQGRVLRLSGRQQRATLGFLLLHPNMVVATSMLRTALWPEGLPNTSRKMLQNSVSGIRRVLSAGGDGPDSPMLLTHAPGYLLRVDPDSVDLHRFHTRVQTGRDQLAEGSFAAAAVTLRDALAMWRGPVLADLAEAGADWPELTTARHARLAAVEDCMDAELACGRYAEVVDELDQWAEAEPLRERLCSQLMRALYYSGRQVDALGVYRRTRTRLIDELGLDPGHELQRLEQAILNHDLPPSIVAARRVRAEAMITVAPTLPESLAPENPAPEPSAAVPAAPPPRAREPRIPLPRTPAPRAPTPSAAVPVAESCAGRPSAALTEEPAPVPEPRREQPEYSCELRRVSVLLLLVHIEPGVEHAAPEDAEEMLQQVTAVAEQEVERARGVSGGRMASLWMATFGATQSTEDDAARAVHAAMNILDRLGPGSVLAPGPVAGLIAKASVTTGEALVRWPAVGSAVPTVSGGLLAQAVSLLAHGAADEVRVCTQTAAESEPSVVYVGHDEEQGARAVAYRAVPAPPRLEIPFVDRERELWTLLGLLDQVRLRSRPHLVTVLGEAGIGKSRLIAEFEQAAAGVARDVTTIVGRTPRFGGPVPLAALSEGLRLHLRIAAGDPEELVEKKLADAVHRLMGEDDRANAIVAHLRALVAPAGSDEDRPGGDADHDRPEGVPDGRADVGLVRERFSPGAFVAWRRFLEQLNGDEPLVVVLEDVQWADDSLLDFVDHLSTEAAPVPLLVVVTARPKLLDRRPSWAGGKLAATTMTLDPLPDDAAARLLALLSRDDRKEPHAEEGAEAVVHRSAVEQVGGNPLFLSEYARALREGQPAVPPPSLHRVVAATIDSLPPRVKAVLLNAAVLSGDISEPKIVAFGGQAPKEVAQALEYLERRGLMHRSHGQEPHLVYTFGYQLLRDVAARMIPALGPVTTPGRPCL